jgi:DeoR/GlpR family transcriptional regulator of sugar metabolism
MLTLHRKTLLLDRLSRDGRLVAVDLAEELGTSEDTIRRDLRDLAAQGLLVRVHGGALPASPTHVSLAARRGMHAREKERLGRAAAGLMQDGQIVIIDGGTTHLALVAALPMSLRATVVTHSPGIAAALEHHPLIEVILIGGRIFRHSMVALGAETQSAYARVRADLCFLGVTGVHPETGLTTGDAEEARLKATMVEVAAETVVLATGDKLRVTSPWQITPLAGLGRLVATGMRPGWLPDRTEFVAA